MIARPVTALLAFCAFLGFSSGYASQWEDFILEADSLSFIGEYSPAESLYQLCVSLAEETYGRDHPNTAASLQGLGNLYKDLSDFGRAESLLVAALNIRLGSQGDASIDIASNRYDLAAVYLYTGRPDEAEEELGAGLSAMTALFGPDALEAAPYYHGLGAVCLQAGRYPEAEALFRRALAIREGSLGPGHPEVMKTMVNLGVLYGNLGRYAEAEPLLAGALTTAESLVGKEHPLVASILLNLGNVYTWLGDYVGARLAFSRALGIMEASFGPVHQDIAGCLDNLATVASEQGLRDEAEELNRRALAIRQEVLGPDHPDVAMSLSNLGTIYTDRGDYERARETLERALAIDRSALGPAHIGVAADLENIAEIALCREDYAMADSLYGEALAIRRAATGGESPEFARTLGYICRLRMKQRRFEEAEALCRRSLAVMEAVFGEEHYAVAENLGRLSEISRHLGRQLAAARLAERAVGIRHRALVENAAVLSEADALAYAELVKRSLDDYLSCYTSLAAGDSAETLNPADVVFSCKGQVSDAIFERNRLVVDEADTAMASIAEALRFARFEMAQMFVEGSGEDPDAYRRAIAEMRDEVENLESELAMRSAGHRTHRRYGNVTAESVVSKLPKSCCLVEYIRYNHVDPIAETSRARYLAVVAAAGSEPVVVPVGWASDVDDLVSRYRRHMLRVSRATSPPTPVDVAEYREIGAALWEVLWGPVAGYASDYRTMFLAADGALNTVSFAGLITPEGDYLVEDATLHYLSSARDLLRPAPDVEQASGLLAFGDPDYDALPRAREGDPAGDRGADGREGAVATRSVRSGCEELSRVNVTRLPGTLKEVRLVEDYWNRSIKEPATVYTGPDAGEARLKAEAKGHRVIHLATHGYFLNDECGGAASGGEAGERPTFVGENPLLLSGLFLAGANRLAGGDPRPDGEDGILTAYEVAMLDLRGTDLIVLSACETGLGRIQQGEGVYGLRRAFQIAGARTVVSVLWPIPDEATAQMAGLLYEREGAPVAERIRRAQMETVGELRSRGEPDHPFMWAGFIAVGAWE